MSPKYITRWGLLCIRMLVYYYWMGLVTALAAKQYFRARLIPYVESFEEQQTRELWERSPFAFVTDVMETVLSSQKHIDKTYPSDCFIHPSAPLLRTQYFDSEIETTGFEDLFSPLYGIMNNSTLQRKPFTLIEEDKLKHFLIRVAYRGTNFCGWQRQPDNSVQPSIQAELEDWLNALTEKKRSIRVCGRTDTGVSAIGQVCRFRTKLDVDAKDVYEHLQRMPNPDISAWHVSSVSRAFHPTFTATCRAYIYLIDWEGDQDVVTKLNQILLPLENREIDYYGMSYGRLKTQTSLCTLYHARARVVSMSTNKERQAVCIELVGNRFLRRMVRKLVEAAMRLAVSTKKTERTALLEQLSQLDRRLIGNIAPPDGLVFVGAQFAEFQ